VICCWCGHDEDLGDEALTVGGQEGAAGDLFAPGWRVYHPRCHKKRRAVKARVENALLSEFNGDRGGGTTRR